MSFSVAKATLESPIYLILDISHLWDMLGGWMGGEDQIFYKLQKHVYVCLLICLLYEFSQCYKHTIPFSFAIAIPFSYHIQPGLQFDLEVHKQTDFITLRCHLVGNIVIKMLLRKCQHFGMTPPHCENSQLFFFWMNPSLSLKHNS